MRIKIMAWLIVGTIIQGMMCHADDSLIIKDEAIALSRIEHAVQQILNDTEYAFLQQYASTVQGASRDMVYAVLSNELNEINTLGYLGIKGFLGSALLLAVGIFGMQKDLLVQQHLFLSRQRVLLLQRRQLLLERSGRAAAAASTNCVKDETASEVRALSYLSRCKILSVLFFSIGLSLPLGDLIIKNYNCVFNQEQIEKKARINSVLLQILKFGVV